MVLEKGRNLPPQGERTPRGRREGGVVPAPLASLSCDGPPGGLKASPPEELAIAGSGEGLGRKMERELYKLEDAQSLDKEEMKGLVADLVDYTSGSPVVDRLAGVLDRMDNTFKMVCWHFWTLTQKYQRMEKSGPRGAPPKPQPTAVTAATEEAKEKRMEPTGPSISPPALAEGSWKEVAKRRGRKSKGKGTSPPVQLPQPSVGGGKREKGRSKEKGGGGGIGRDTTPPREGFIWVRLPLSEIERGKGSRGGSVATTRLAAARGSPETVTGRCFRCLEVGHFRDDCTSKRDRTGRCFRCGALGHRMRGCVAAPRCALCVDRGRSADHVLGGEGCVTPPPPQRRCLRRASPTLPGGPAQEPGPPDRTGVGGRHPPGQV